MAALTVNQRLRRAGQLRDRTWDQLEVARLNLQAAARSYTTEGSYKNQMALLQAALDSARLERAHSRASRAVKALLEQMVWPGDSPMQRLQARQAQMTAQEGGAL